VADNDGPGTNFSHRIIFQNQKRSERLDGKAPRFHDELKGIGGSSLRRNRSSTDLQLVELKFKIKSISIRRMKHSESVEVLLIFKDTLASFRFNPSEARMSDFESIWQSN